MRSPVAIQIPTVDTVKPYWNTNKWAVGERFVILWSKNSILECLESIEKLTYCGIEQSYIKNINI